MKDATTVSPVASSLLRAGEDFGLEVPVFRSPGTKELAALWGRSVRHLRRLQNESGLITPSAPGSARVGAYPKEEFIRFCAWCYTKNQEYDRTTARDLKLTEILEWIRLRVRTVEEEENPTRAALGRHDKLLELLAFGNSAPVCEQLGMTPFERTEWTEMAERHLRLVLQAPSARRILGAAFTQAIQLAALGRGIEAGEPQRESPLKPDASARATTSLLIP